MPPTAGQRGGLHAGNRAGGVTSRRAETVVHARARSRGGLARRVRDRWEGRRVGRPERSSWHLAPIARSLEQEPAAIVEERVTLLRPGDSTTSSPVPPTIPFPMLPGLFGSRCSGCSTLTIPSRGTLWGAMVNCRVTQLSRFTRSPRVWVQLRSAAMIVSSQLVACRVAGRTVSRPIRRRRGHYFRGSRRDARKLCK